MSVSRHTVFALTLLTALASGCAQLQGSSTSPWPRNGDEPFDWVGRISPKPDAAPAAPPSAARPGAQPPLHGDGAPASQPR